MISGIVIGKYTTWITFTLQKSVADQEGGVLGANPPPPPSKLVNDIHMYIPSVYVSRYTDGTVRARYASHKMM